MKNPLAGAFVQLDPILDTSEAAMYVRAGVSSMARWRREGVGPAFVRIGVRRYGYRKSALDKFLSGGAAEPVEAPEVAA